MTTSRVLHPWVENRRDRISFGIQLIASKDSVPGPVLVAAAKKVEDLGFDAVYLGDHPAWAPESYVHLTAMAMATQRVFLGPMVAAAPYRNPVMTARLLSDIDHLSGGRVINGLGIGWNASDWELGTNEFERMGIPYPATRVRQQALEEVITIIRGAWGEEPFTFAGEHYQVADVTIPAPVQQPEPPLVIAGGGKRTLGQVARLADMSNFGSGPAGGTDSLGVARERLQTLERACVENDRSYDDILRSHFVHWFMLAETDEALERKKAHYFPEGISGFWATGLVALTVDQAIEYFREYIEIGMQCFVLQTLDPSGDVETLEMLSERVSKVLNTTITTAS